MAVEYVPRAVEPQIRQGLRDFAVVRLRGPRRVGKTTVARQIASTDWDLLDDERVAALRDDADGMLRRAEPPLLIDEWQRFPEIVAAVKRATDRGYCRDIIMAGSVDPRPPKAGQAGGSPMEGRWREIDVWPLSVAEQKGCVDPGLADALLDGQLERACEQLERADYLNLFLESGFPDAVGTTGRARRAQLNAVVDAAIEAGIHREGPGRRPTSDTFREFVQVAAHHTGTYTSMNSLAAEMGVASPTASNYSDLARSVRLTADVGLWRRNRDMARSPRRKRLLVEAALVPVLGEFSDQQLISDGSFAGKMCETFVASQLRALQSASPHEFSLMAYDVNGRTKQADPSLASFPTGEIDFVVQSAEGRGTAAIEVKTARTAYRRDANRLQQLRDAMDDRDEPATGRFAAGVVLYCGEGEPVQVDDRIWLAPVSLLWSLSAAQLRLRS